ncbi:MAG TPA: radical SAM protein [Nitrosomonas halophila]|nr:radical SAM protein [Nitrosomonas halophila]
MQPTVKRLTPEDHSRDSAGLTYVYPVVSRRAGGLSIGINLNPNNACNWRCLYCQVPALKRGSAPAIDLPKLEQELRGFLHELIYGRFMQEKVPPEARVIHDIALSGNGEPTSAQEFEQVIRVIGEVKDEFPLPDTLKVILITNGSLIHRETVQNGLGRLAKLNGEIWFKLDSVTKAGRLQVNNTRMSLARMRENLCLAASLCPTWLQTCVFKLDEAPPAQTELDAYISFVDALLRDGAQIKGVLLYTLARPSLQPEAARLSKVSKEWMETFAARIKALGIPVNVTP